jgi:hypothetical protein
MATLRVGYLAGNKGMNADRIDDTRRGLMIRMKSTSRTSSQSSTALQTSVILSVE